MKPILQPLLAPLVGLPLWRLEHREGLLASFGARLSGRSAQTGRVFEYGELALKVACAWRLTANSHVYAGWWDVDAPEDEDVDEYDPDRHVSRFEARLLPLSGRMHRGELRVLSVDADELGGLRLELSEELALEVFPLSSAADDWSWWLRRPDGSRLYACVDRLELVPPGGEPQVVHRCGPLPAFAPAGSLPDGDTPGWAGWTLPEDPA